MHYRFFKVKNFSILENIRSIVIAKKATVMVPFKIRLICIDLNPCIIKSPHPPEPTSEVKVADDIVKIKDILMMHPLLS